MTGLDTDVVVRFFIEDDSRQFRSAVHLLESFTPQAPGYISLTCLAEFVWVTRARYAIPKGQLIAWITRMLQAPEFILESESVVEEAIQLFAASKADLADCLIERSCRAAGCERTDTFDRAAIESAGMSILRT